MKKNVIIVSAVLVGLSLMAFSFINWDKPVNTHTEVACNVTPGSNVEIGWNNPKKTSPSFMYDISTRFSSITKSELDKVTSAADFLSKEEIERIVSYKSLQIRIIEDDKQTDKKVEGTTDLLTLDQINMLQSFDYSTNFAVRVDFQQRNGYTGKLEDNYSTPHLTMIPEKQAEYTQGKDALINYLKENSKAEVATVQEDKLRPAKIYFTVTKQGTISEVKLTGTSGYPVIDNKMMELIKNLPGEWKVAKNAKGKKVDQELVFSFGIMGC